jgi:uncharacterized protein (TIGR02001 family)
VISLHKTIMTVTAAALMVSIPSFAGDAFSFSADLTTASSYVWRGYDVLDGVELPVQPSLTVAHSSGLSLNAWGSFGLLDRSSGVDNWDEVDVTLDYNRDLNDMFSMSAGVIVYLFPNTSTAKTMELYASVSAKTILSPSVSVYYDTKFIDDSAAEADDIYLSLGLGHSVSVTEKMALDLAGEIAWNKDEGIVTGLTASTGIALKKVTLTPFVSVVYADESINPDNVVVFGGVTASYGF